MPKVSIVMPSYNVAPYIRECMDSVIGQTLKDIEIIVVDAGSTDGTRQILEEYVKKDSRVILLEDEKKSSGYANNKAIDYASGEYIGIVETDDYIAPDMYEKLYGYAKKYRAEVVKADYDSFTAVEGRRVFVSHNLLGVRRKYYQVLNPLKNKFVFGAEMFNWAGIYRLDFLNRYQIRHQETPGAAFQDNGFWFQIFAFAQRVVFIHESFYRYRKDNPGSSINSKGKNSKEKGFCMCGEYDFAKRKVEQYPEIWEKIYYAYLGKRYGACAWALRKTDSEHRWALCSRLYEDFSREIKNLGEINKIWPEKNSCHKELKMLLSNRESYLDYMEQKLRQYDKKIEKLLKQISGRKLVVFGSGNWGTELQALLAGKHIVLEAFCDNDIKKQGKDINGIRVSSLEELLNSKNDLFWIVASAMHNREICGQLLHCGVEKKDIFIYRRSKYIWD